MDIVGLFKVILAIWFVVAHVGAVIEMGNNQEGKFTGMAVLWYFVVFIYVLITGT